MSSPRFLLTCSSSATGTQVLWRLVAGNNHDLGRGPLPEDSEAAARGAVESLRAGLDRVTTSAAPDSRPGRWSWQVLLDGAVVAVSSRAYERQRESRYSAAQFLTAARVADVAPTLVVRGRRGSRAGYRTPLTATDDGPVLPAQAPAPAEETGVRSSGAPARSPW